MDQHDLRIHDDDDEEIAELRSQVESLEERNRKAFGRLRTANHNTAAARQQRDAAREELAELRRAVTAFLADETITGYERAHRYPDPDFAAGVPQYATDCAELVVPFDLLRAALEKAGG